MEAWYLGRQDVQVGEAHEVREAFERQGSLRGQKCLSGEDCLGDTSAKMGLNF
jgi:hypothetical protein